MLMFSKYYALEISLLQRYRLSVYTSNDAIVVPIYSIPLSGKSLHLFLPAIWTPDRSVTLYLEWFYSGLLFGPQPYSNHVEPL